MTMRFTKRERYCKALKHMFNNWGKYRVVSRGKDYGADIKANGADNAWYIDFVLVN